MSNAGKSTPTAPILTLTSPSTVEAAVDVGDPEPRDLQQREEALAAQEIEMALSEAQLRGQEGHVSALGAALATRGAWIDAQVAQLATWATSAGVDADAILHGLGGGAATEEADLARYVQRSETLLVGRAAMIATRAEVVQRRTDQLSDRGRELEAYEQAFVRAEVRLTARERLLRDAIGELQHAAAAGAAAPPPEPLFGPDSSKHRHAQTVSMSPAETAALNAAAIAGRSSSSPPVLDFSVEALWRQITAPAPLKAVGPDSKTGSAIPHAMNEGIEPLIRHGRTRATDPIGGDRPRPTPPPRGSLSLAGLALGRSDVEVDRASRVVLVSLSEPSNLSGLVDLVGRDARGEAHCFPVRVQLVMPGNDGVGAAVVLSAGSWSTADFDDFEAVLGGLS